SLNLQKAVPGAIYLLGINKNRGQAKTEEKEHFVHDCYRIKITGSKLTKIVSGYLVSYKRTIPNNLLLGTKTLSVKILGKSVLHLILYITLAKYKTTHEPFFYLERFFLFLFLLQR